MSLDDDKHASSHKKKMKTRRSMDIEFHDHLDDALIDELEDLDVDSDSDGNRPKRNLDDDLDDDSFGEASDSCEPDHEFLDQILDECHPERINLLDPTVPESYYNRQPRSREPTVVSNGGPHKKQENEESQRLGDNSMCCRTVNESSCAENIDTGNGAHAKPKRNILGENITEDSESNTEEENDDAFTKSPQRRGPQLSLDRTKMLGSMGKSTKKSLRAINGTFWSKPFKGLAQSMRRNGGAQGVADS